MSVCRPMLVSPGTSGYHKAMVNPRAFAARCQSGFTVPELLVVIGMFAVVAVTAFFVLQPKDTSTATTAAERRLAVAQTVQMLARYHADKDAWPAGLSAKLTPMGTETGEVNLCADLVPAYGKDLPFDPLSGAAVNEAMTEIADTACREGVKYETGLRIQLSADGAHVTVSVPALLGNQAVAITR